MEWVKKWVEKRKKPVKVVPKEEIWEELERKGHIDPIFMVLGLVALIFFGFTLLSIKMSPRPLRTVLRTLILYFLFCAIILPLYFKWRPNRIDKKLEKESGKSEDKRG